MNKQQALSKIEELKKFIESCDKEEEWVKIDYSVIPKEIFDRYGIKPFEIMKKKAMEDGKTIANITWSDAKRRAKEMGYRLPTIQEMLVLLDFYKQKFPDNASIHHDEFLGIEELSYDQNVYYEWIDSPCSAFRGGYWGTGSTAGAFALALSWPGGGTSSVVGFRCARGI